ncbi:MAG: hypothetical protein NDJ89_19025 [Oligoflexia bacterium]|nr:hypothetical protein [Oligoflexia bacterium]
MKIDATVALAALTSLGDGHLSKLAATLGVLARSPEARSAEWDKLREPLAAAARDNVEALNWFALPDGSYWSVQNGQETGNLSDRAYFPRLLRGETVIGELVVSKATGKSSAIVAVPVRRGSEVVGALGASVFLDKLSAQIERELGLDDTMIFYSFDAKPTVALDWDPAIIFADPMQLGPEVSRAFREMLSKEEGSVQYAFRGRKRKVIFRRSGLTGWWYAFGLIPEGRERPGSASGQR